MTNNINILVYRSTRSNLDTAREKIITELSERGIKVNYGRASNIVKVYKTANECVKIWFVSRISILRSLRPVPFDYYNIGYSQDSNVDIINIIKFEFFEIKPLSLGDVIHITADFVADKKSLSWRYDSTIPLVMAKNAINSVYGITNISSDYRDCIKDVIHNNPATIVFWADGTKTVVKADDEEYDQEKGLAMAFSKKMFGNDGNYYNVFKKWLPKETEEK